MWSLKKAMTGSDLYFRKPEARQGVHLNLEHEPGERPQGLQRQGVEMTGLTERTKRLD